MREFSEVGEEIEMVGDDHVAVFSDESMADEGLTS